MTGSPDRGKSPGCSPAKIIPSILVVPLYPSTDFVALSNPHDCLTGWSAQEILQAARRSLYLQRHQTNRKQHRPADSWQARTATQYLYKELVRL